MIEQSKDYLKLINEVDLDYLVQQLHNGKLNTKALSQRIYRTENVQDKLTMKVALCIFQLCKK